MGKDEQRIRDRFQFPDSVNIRIPNDEGGFVTLMLMRFVFMRLILSVAFVSLFIPLLGNFFSICILLQHSECLTFGRFLFLTW